MAMTRVEEIRQEALKYNLRLSMEFTHDGNDPRFAVWNNVDGDKALCHVTYSFDWFTTLKRLINGAKNGYEIWTQAKGVSTARPKVNKDGNNVSASPND